MKHNKLKTIAAIIGMAATMVCSITGCGEKEESQSQIVSEENNNSDNTEDGEKDVLSEFSQYAVSTDEIVIPDNVRIVALGEATHGNNEFQELKLDVFRHLVETTDVRAFALEGDMGGCELVNEYIQGGEGSPEDVVKYLGYRIYKTDNMIELIEWMRDYNMTADEDQKVRFYGLDMQYTDYGILAINNYLSLVDPDNAEEYKAEIESYFGIEDCSYDPERKDEILAFVDDFLAEMGNNREAYVEISGEERFEITCRIIGNLAFTVNYREDGYSSEYRDTCMKENALWILDLEENMHSAELMMSSHNGHMSKNISTPNTFLGNYLYNELGDDYFAIGTDFYNTTDNLPGADGTRENHEFCSEDPLAECVGEMPENVYYLDFSEAQESEVLSEIINNTMTTGSLGEEYAPGMEVLKWSYQINNAPTEMYDAMIFVYEATPIEIKY